MKSEFSYLEHLNFVPFQDVHLEQHFFQLGFFTLSYIGNFVGRLEFAVEFKCFQRKNFQEKNMIMFHSEEMKDVRDWKNL